MHNLTFPVVAPEEVLSSRFRVHAVTGDAMEPTFRAGRDYALLAPVTEYEGEGIYLVDVGFRLDLFRVSNTFDGRGGLLLSQEKRGRAIHLSREEFRALVVGIVVADIRTRDERFLRRSA